MTERFSKQQKLSHNTKTNVPLVSLSLSFYRCNPSSTMIKAASLNVEEDVGLRSLHLGRRHGHHALVVAAHPLLAAHDTAADTGRVGCRSLGAYVRNVVPRVEAALVRHHSCQVVDDPLLLILLLLVLLVLLFTGGRRGVAFAEHKLGQVEALQVEQNLGVNLYVAGVSK